MARWMVKFLDSSKDYFEADTYDASVGTFRTLTESVAYVNKDAVKYVQRVSEESKGEALRRAGISEGMTAR